MREVGIWFPLVQGNAERVPFADECFDIVFADHGAFSFTDPYQTVPESARVLRRGGMLAFSHTSPICEIGRPVGTDHASRWLARDYFGLYQMEAPDGRVEFDLPYGAWVRLFRRCGLLVEDLIEPQPGPDATSTYRDVGDLAWARRWPSECIWRARKA